MSFFGGRDIEEALHLSYPWRPDNRRFHNDSCLGHRRLRARTSLTLRTYLAQRRKAAKSSVFAPLSLREPFLKKPAPDKKSPDPGVFAAVPLDASRSDTG